MRIQPLTVGYNNSMSNKQYAAPPALSIDLAKTYTATIETVAGTMELELYAAEAPMTVNNFVFLAREGFYDNVIFHRVIKGFMIQGGDPTGTGRGGPGYRFSDETVSRKYTRGTLAMARTNDPNSATSEFFINHVDNGFLNFIVLPLKIVFKNHCVNNDRVKK